VESGRGERALEELKWPFEATLLSWGAESNLYLSTYLGRRVIVKHRFRKPYMSEELARRLVRERTAAEARILYASNEAGVKAPLPVYVDVESGVLAMEYIEGELLRDAMPRLSEDTLRELARRLGSYVARLHDAGIIHGDLTTSNIMLKGGEVFLLDFGLSYFSSRPNDRASDIRVLERAVASTHPGAFQSFFEEFLEAYMREAKLAEKTYAEFLKLSTMGRYHKKRYSY